MARPGGLAENSPVGQESAELFLGWSNQDPAGARPTTGGATSVGGG